VSIALASVIAAAESTFDLSSLTATATRNNTSGGTFAAQTWTVILTEPAEFLSYVCDSFQADTYTFSIDAVNIASVVCGATSTNNTFTPAAPVYLAAGSHTFKIIGTASRRYYYISGTTAPALTGTGARWLSWFRWAEGGASTTPAGACNFRPIAGLQDAGPAAADNHSTATTWTAQTWTITFGTAAKLCGLQMQVDQAGTYTLSIDGVDVATAAPATGGGEWMTFNLQPAPVALTAAAHTFKIRRSTATRFYYLNSTANPTIAGVGAAYITGWGVFQEFDAVHCPSAFLILTP
jgi:hypothetical protein